MSVKLTARVWALDDKELKDARLLTLLALADFANELGLAWPSVPTLAQRTRICERQVQRAIQWLAEQSYIEIATKGNGRGNLTTYKVSLKGDMITPFSDVKGDTVTPIDSIKGDIPNIKGDIGDEIQSYARREPLTTEPTTEGKEIAANAAPLATPPVAELPKPKRSRKSQTPPHSEAPPKEPSEWNLFLEAFCWVCHGHKDIGSLTEAKRGQLVSEGKVIRDKNFSTDDLREWYKRIWGHSWQYKRDNTARPLPSDVRSSIAQLRAETPTGFEVAAVAAQPTSNAANNRQAVSNVFAKVRAQQGANSHG